MKLPPGRCHFNFNPERLGSMHGGNRISTATLTTSILIGAATSGFLAYAGRVIQRRRAKGDDHGAVRAFAVWWYAASVVILDTTVRSALALLGVTDLALHAALQYFVNLAVAVALGALMYYILYLLTGMRKLLKPVVVVYGLYFCYLIWYSVRAGPRELVMGDWSVTLRGENNPTTTETLVFGLLLTAPVLTTVLAFSILAFHVQDRVPRYRMSMVAGAFLFLFGMIFLAYVLGWSRQPWFPLAYQLPALAASVIVLLAYRPPPPVQRWLDRGTPNP